MNTLKKIVRSTPIVREVALFLLRCKLAFSYGAVQLKELFVWLFTSREFTNFTYDLTDLNKQYLIMLIASVTGKNFQEISFYVAELENDIALRSHIQSAIKESDQKYFADLDVHYGRRMGWYALVRATKPRIVVETGVDKGLGSCVLTAALMRNDRDGYSGYYYGTDINPIAGYLLSGNYKKYGKILYGDSITSLKNMDFEIDLFINDSDHSSDYEEKEYEAIANKLSLSAIILGDNSQYTNKLLNFALASNRKFVFFQEKPLKHWYSGEGNGIVFTDRQVK